ncbi:MAG: hypothetical protein IT559_07955 [Alphaproteobacteria bacterium]|nr:hypothetical protein [Alphaproteobacteria bacterium]
MYRKFFVVLIAGASLGAPFVSSAQGAEPELAFYPAGGWSVGKTGEICSATGSYNNGFDLRFEGSKGKMTQMSVDFHQDIFKKDQSYDARVALVEGAAKKVLAVNTAPGILSFNVADDKEFYRGLGKASALDLSVEQNSFRFHLPGFARAFSNFEACVNGDVAANSVAAKPPVLAETPPASPDFTVNEAVAMEAEIKAPAAAAPLLDSASAPAASPPPSVKSEPAAAEAVASKKAVPVPDPVLVVETSKVAAETPVEKAERAFPSSERTVFEHLPEMVVDTVSASAPVASVATAPAAKPLVAPAPGLVNKNNLSPEQVSRMIARQMGVENAPVTEPSNLPAEAASAAPLMAQDMAGPQKPAADQDAISPPKPSAEKETIVFSTPERAIPAPVGMPDPLLPDDENSMNEVAAVPVQAAPVVPQTVRTSSGEAVVHTSTIRAEADFTNASEIEPASAGDEAGFPAMGRGANFGNAREMQDTIDALRAENAALNSELKSMIRDTEKERLSITSENWNLEQATMKFNEAERQIKRLGLELQKERARSENERKELEAMLFDPKLTNQSQLARLAELEAQLAKAKEELQLQKLRYGERVRSTEASSGADLSGVDAP